MSFISGILTAALGTVAIAVFGIVAGLLLLGIDRKFAAHMQARVGPPLRQPFIDVAKLFCKDNIVPESAVPSIFNVAPVIALASSITILLYIPVGSTAPLLGKFGDIILVMYLLNVPALAMIAGGFSSGSPYATIGAQREMITMIAYELPLIIVVITVAWRLSAAGLSDPFSLGVISGVTSKIIIWDVLGPVGIVGCILFMLILVFVTPAELSRVPCDTPEAETELCGGLLVEYSGRNLALFYLAGGVKTLAMLALIVAVFLPWNLSWFISLPTMIAPVVDLLFYFLKLVVVLFFSVTLIRVSMARFRINHLVSFYWIYITLIGLFALFLVGIDAFILEGV
ncbi:respiratory chain complex I subunit 1 family protein [Methanoplanus limicola]|uniref:Respiratory-chain NADH dehydrogenase subunit 1 n=1 Tax=Methanoplanus limicola DSM 2279 TaxID=937775 RepID=H1Z3Q5_9EURY|nr:complex I subunit 1 family protein [Methanoplanus limicola]EHQ35654.1 respiratory-chain NADH dehydrogenase subunit 1 [Methanoplanus limicola DSM 2279]